MRSQLLCTFTTVYELPESITQVHRTYGVDNVENMRCYQYNGEQNVVCIYNTYNTTSRMKGTITINRKKDTDTIYSINALNALIREQNNGVLDKTYRVEWENYTNRLLLTDREGNFRCIEIKQLQ
tara:strand:+ start:2057 stop:2431 length:375 start_codon:yes stop_codon:yes gene_type:complete